MASIADAIKAVAEFSKKTFGAKDVKVIKAIKVGDVWEAEAEVFEESAFIKALGLPTKVQDRNIYVVKLNKSLGVESYERKEQAKTGE